MKASASTLKFHRFSFYKKRSSSLQPEIIIYELYEYFKVVVQKVEIKRLNNKLNFF